MQPECTGDGSGVKHCSVKTYVISAFLGVLYCALAVYRLGTREKFSLFSVLTHNWVLKLEFNTNLL